jgi:hypoxia up-regulated 1
MTRTFPHEAPEYHLFYDAGAGSIQATVVALQTKEVKDDPSSKFLKNVTSVEVKGIGWDLSAGGTHMDGRVRDILELQYITGDGRQLQTPFAQNKRAQAKLMKEASRVKQVLSANAQAPSRVSRNDYLQTTLRTGS